ncbi:MAG: protease modulator HflC [Pseudomonadota bacterium]
MQKMIIALAALVVAGLWLVNEIAYTVRETEQVLILQFGKALEVVDTPGLYFKIPFVQTTTYLDKRVLDYDARAQEVPTQDQKQLIVDAFARYRIVDPLNFFQTVQSEAGMQVRLDSLINAALRAVLGDVELAVVLTPKRSELMSLFTERVALEASEFGIEVIDVRIKRIDLPQENSEAIFRRMSTQREQEARKIRAEGGKEARTIRAEADRRKRVIVAEAQRTGEILRGEGDGAAQEIYNAAYGQDAEFFDFWRSMQALRKGVSGQTTTYVGPPQGDFFRFFFQEKSVGEGNQ